MINALLVVMSFTVLCLVMTHCEAVSAARSTKLHFFRVFLSVICPSRCYVMLLKIFFKVDPPGSHRVSFELTYWVSRFWSRWWGYRTAGESQTCVTTCARSLSAQVFNTPALAYSLLAHEKLKRIACKLKRTFIWDSYAPLAHISCNAFTFWLWCFSPNHFAGCLMSKTCVGRVCCINCSPLRVFQVMQGKFIHILIYKLCLAC